MPDDQVTTVDLSPLGCESDRLRELLASRVRLKVSERRRWWAKSVFTVTGPKWAVDELTQEVERMDCQAWEDRLW